MNQETHQERLDLVETILQRFKLEVGLHTHGN